jgi:hypothetical protein
MALTSEAIDDLGDDIIKLLKQSFLILRSLTHRKPS